jgi:tetratricopeptide (TPR) repeat protein
LKNNLIKYTFVLGFVILVVACSTKRNGFLNRKNHALSTKYNILYNGGVALDKGVNELKTKYNDNFWEQLPIERMQTNTVALLPGQEKKNPNFDRAETKAIKAIQRHSMNIEGSEKNPQMDEAHLMLGKSRYYDQRFVPALEAFNYILYKYPNSDKIYEAKIWREKTNMRMDNDALAINNLRNLLKEIKFKDQIFADANATLAQAFLNLNEKDSAMSKLVLARDFTKIKEEKARYYFILGQLFENANQKDSAFASYQSVIEMNRNASRMYVMQAHARQAAQFDYEKGDTIAFLKKFNDLLLDRENRPYLDVLNHQMALFYDKKKNFTQAKKHYNVSLRKKSDDQYMVASNYRNLADIYFNDAKYVNAGKYYDSTLVALNDRSREFRFIKKKRENLDDVIKYEGIANTNDSILKVLAMSPTARIGYYEDYIVKLKKADEIKKALEEKLAKEAKNDSANQNDNGIVDMGESKMEKIAQKSREAVDEKAAPKQVVPKNNPSKSGSFYFYNPSTVAYGKIEFKKLWGTRALKENWRFSKSDAKGASQDDSASDASNDLADADAKSKAENEKYSAQYYLEKLPKDQKEIDLLAKDRNFAYYQLGVIYKEKFKEYKLAASKLEKLLVNNPEERLILPAMYNLFKIYEIIDKDKALAMKDRIINEFPTSRYAQILGKSGTEDAASIASPNAVYDKLYDNYLKGDFKKVLPETTAAIDQFTGEEIVPKLELLKANTLGKLKGLDEYKKSLNFVALNYPNSEEGKKAEALLGKEVPQMEALQFYDIEPKSWKIIYKAQDSTEVNTRFLTEKIQKFLKDRTVDRLTLSNDIYTMDKNFVVIHGLYSEEYAKGIAQILKEFKDYQITDQAYVISNENYKIVQIKKNFETYLTTPVTAPKPKAATPLPPLRGAPEPAKTTNNDSQKANNLPPTLDSDDPEEKKPDTNGPQNPRGNPGQPQMQMENPSEMKPKR